MQLTYKISRYNLKAKQMKNSKLPDSGKVENVSAVRPVVISLLKELKAS